MKLKQLTIERPSTLQAWHRSPEGNCIAAIRGGEEPDASHLTLGCPLVNQTWRPAPGPTEAARCRSLLDAERGSGSIQPMDRTEAMGQMRAMCNDLGNTVTRLHPLVPRLNAPPAQAEILKALFELTKQVEVVKKHLIRLEKDDANTVL
jgi:hypothetical protein